jgi:hypothetical protein
MRGETKLPDSCTVFICLYFNIYINFLPLTSGLGLDAAQSVQILLLICKTFSLRCLAKYMCTSLSVSAVCDIESESETWVMYFRKAKYETLKMNEYRTLM